MNFEYYAIWINIKPYGLSSSPSVFQGFMIEVFQEFLHRLIVNADDLCVFMWPCHKWCTPNALTELRTYNGRHVHEIIETE